MRALQNKALRHRKLDIHFSIHKVYIFLLVTKDFNKIKKVQNEKRVQHMTISKVYILADSFSRVFGFYANSNVFHSIWHNFLFPFWPFLFPNMSTPLCSHIQVEDFLTMGICCQDNPSENDINQGTLAVFNLDSSVLNDDLRQIFGVYGDIKEVRLLTLQLHASLSNSFGLPSALLTLISHGQIGDTPHKYNYKFIEFYDVRDAEDALNALNRSDVAGRRIKVEPSRHGGARHWYCLTTLVLSLFLFLGLHLKKIL